MDVLNVTGYHRRPPHLVAEYRGFFAAEGLDVQFHETTFAPVHNRGMAEGRWDFTLSSADTMIARTTTDAIDYLLFMQAEEGLSAYLMGHPGVRSVADLRGQLLADTFRSALGRESRGRDADTAGVAQSTGRRKSAAGQRGRLCPRLAAHLRLGTA